MTADGTPVDGETDADVDPGASSDPAPEGGPVVDGDGAAGPAFEYAPPEGVDADAAHRCGRCGRPFARAEWLDLHRGLAHAADLTDEEVAAFRTAHAAENDEIRLFRLKALGLLVVVYFTLLLIYAVL